MADRRKPQRTARYSEIAFRVFMSIVLATTLIPSDRGYAMDQVMVYDEYGNPIMWTDSMHSSSSDDYDETDTDSSFSDETESGQQESDDDEPDVYKPELIDDTDADDEYHTDDTEEELTNECAEDETSLEESPTLEDDEGESKEDADEDVATDVDSDAVAKSSERASGGLLPKSSKDEEQGPTELVFEDDELIVTVKAPKGAFPKGATLEVEAIRPDTYERAEAYAEALTSLSEHLRESDETYVSPQVLDIHVLDDKGEEIEPTDTVSVTIKYASPKKVQGEVEVAHLYEDGDVEIVDADINTNSKGAVKAASFDAESFSYYIVFGTNTGVEADAEPTSIGSYGWIKFKTPVNSNQWGDFDPNGLPALGTEDAYKRILKVNLWVANVGVTGGPYNDTNYTLATGNDSQKYFWTWENEIRVDDFDLPNHEVLHTHMHRAWDDGTNDRDNDSVIDTYSVRGYQSSDNTSSQLNTLDIYVKAVTHSDNDEMRYVIRYVHADGSISDNNIRYLASGSTQVNFSAQDHKRDGEIYAGYSIVAGAGAISITNGSTGIGNIQYNSKIDLAKIYIYYEKAPTDNGDNIENQNRVYDCHVYDENNKKYYTAEEGLHTYKYAKTVAGDDRKFLVNLEAWYVDKPASVGMVLDASGSMAWTAGTPTPIQKTEAEWNAIFENTTWKNTYYTSSFTYRALDNADVANLQSKGILDVTRCDNSSMGYNGYHYYIFSNRKDVNEYVALGYTDGSTTDDVELFDVIQDSGTSGSNIYYQLGDNTNGYIGYANRSRNLNSGNAGWYYVNSSGDVNKYLTKTGKSYDGISAWDGSSSSSSSAGPSKFYIDSEGFLCCIFSDGRKDAAGTPGASGNIVYNTSSRVYEKRETMLTKNETLQDAVSQFGSILLGVSPHSEVSMTRFSQNIETSGSNRSKRWQNTKYLPLMNWTSDPKEIAAALDLSYGAVGSTKRQKPEDDSEKYPVACYEYGLTGQTRTYTGVKAYIDHFKGKANIDNHKYLIIFTDGKDTNGDATASPWGETGEYTSQLKDAGYSIITVLMKSQGMDASGETDDARKFLKGIASGGKDGDPEAKLLYEADSTDAHGMVEEFRKIANQIAVGLEDYTVRDYIDPRFDVINDAGDVLSVLDDQGKFTNGVDANGHRIFTTPDGKQAKLGYDSENKMFYVMWQKQDIPATNLKSEEVVNLWQGQIRLQAKEDFIGGNDVLTNGNAEDENMVYQPITKAGTNEPDYDDYGREQVNTNKKTDTFPFASVNPGLLDVKLGNYEDTIFLGEKITPGKLLSTMMESTLDAPKDRVDSSHRIADTVYNVTAMANKGNVDGSGKYDADQSSIWYVEYLERLGKKIHNNKDFYYTILRHVNLDDEDIGLHSLITALGNNGNYTFTDSNGVVTATGKQNTVAADETITITKNDNSASIRLVVPYYYLECPTDSSSYAGALDNSKVDVGDDKVGTLTYEWKVLNFAGNDPEADTNNEKNRFVQFDTYVDKNTHMDVSQDLKYQFSISYEPEGIGGAADQNNDGSDRTKALTGKSGDKIPILDAVGATRVAVAGEQNTTDEEGLAVIHAVDGRILVEKRMLTADLEKMQTKYPDARLTLNLTGAGITAGNVNETVWSASIPKISEATGLRTEGNYTYLTIASPWATGLPLGDYTLTETLSDEYGTPTIKGTDVIQFHNDSADPAYPYSNAVATWKASYSGATWSIGKVPASDTKTYQDTDYSYGVVTDTSATRKQVDPLLSKNNGKSYLNAQIGHAIATNQPAVTSIDVSKTWVGITPSSPIVIKLTGSDGSIRYRELNASNSWSATFIKLDVDGTTYTAEEGTGTVSGTGPDYECSDFSAFNTSADRYTFDGKTYKQTSVIYTDKVPTGGTPQTDKIVANVNVDAGSIDFTNECVTKVEVQKHWEGITPGDPTSPEKPLVARLHASDGRDYYATLNTSNNWTHTFEDLPCKTGLTYTLVEGVGTVAQDGTCSDFEPHLATATYTFDGKTYRQKENSLIYTSAGAGATTNTTGLDGSISPDAGKAEVTNEALTDIRVEKEWANDSTPDSESIYIQLYKGNETVDDPVELSDAKGWTHTYSNLKVAEGVVYTVKEGRLESGTFQEFGSTFMINGQRMRCKGTKIYSDTGKTTEEDKLYGSVSPFGGVEVITNGVVLGRVKLKKIDATDNDKTLVGASFELYKDANTPATGSAVYEAAIDTVKVTGTGDVTTFTTDSTGLVTLPDLDSGTYWLKEIAAPVGYMLRDPGHPTGIVVDNEGKVTIIADSTYESKMTPAVSAAADGDGYYTLTMPNLHTYALPAAGGLGNYPFLIAGAFICAYAMTGSRESRRRRLNHGHLPGDGLSS